MYQENIKSPDWERLPWQESPYSGVFTCIIFEEPGLNDPVPIQTVMGLKVKSESSIPLHRHKRDSSWKETFIFEGTGLNFLIHGSLGEMEVMQPLSFTIDAQTVFGLTNLSSQTLHFTSHMRPGDRKSTRLNSSHRL